MSRKERGENKTPYIDRGEPLPGSYAEDRIVALLRGPETIFVYWDVATEVRVAGSPLVLRTRCLSEETAGEIEPEPGANKMYFHVTPNRAYHFEILERTAAGEPRLLAASNVTVTPVRRPEDFGMTPPIEILHAERHPLTRTKTPAHGDALQGEILRPRQPPKKKPVPTALPSPAPSPVSGELHGPFYQSGRLS